MNTIDMPDFDTYMCLVTTTKEGKKPTRADRYYEKVYHQLEARKRSWNWSAALFTVSWFCYRKMYLYGLLTFFGALFFIALYMLTLGGLGYLVYTLNPFDISTFFLTKSGKILLVIICFLCIIPFQAWVGLNANKLYLKHIRKKIENNYHRGNTIKNTDVMILILPYTCTILNHLFFSKNTPSEESTLEIIMMLVSSFIVIPKAFMTYYLDKQKVKRAMAYETLPKDAGLS